MSQLGPGVELELGIRCGRRAIVIGSGKRAEVLLRRFQRENSYALTVVALVDLAAACPGRNLHGIPVLGSIDNLPELAQRLKAELAVIALDPPDFPEMRRVVEQCIAAELEFKTLSSPEQVGEGFSGASLLRNVRIDDVLVSPPITSNLTFLRTDLQHRVILLTGAAGSVGSELARQIVLFNPARLVLLDQSESDLYFLHLQLKAAHPGVELTSVICDITNQTRLTQVFEQHRPDYVIHAAAYKHVPLLEDNVFEAVRNNVLGTLLVATAAVRFGATKMLLVSTDKAVRPSSVIGATKRVAERIIFGLPNLHRSGTDFRAVRLGNLLGSRGSVIPLFEHQLAAGGPITVSHPLAQCHFMTIRDAARLVLQAGSLPDSAGSLAMLEMGEPVSIVDLAEKLIRFSGRVPGKDICIVYTGLRPAEKLVEEQSSALESTIPTSAEKIRISLVAESEPDFLIQRLSRLLGFLESGDRGNLLSTLCDLVPECVSPLRESHRPSASLPFVAAAEAWTALVKAAEARRGERRRGMQRLAEAPSISLSDRREGEVCRRKTPRMGGRRQTDAAAPVATAVGCNA